MKTFLGLYSVLSVLSAHAVTLHVAAEGGNVPPFSTTQTAARSVQAAIEQASDGDIVRIAPGRYRGDIDFLGKAIIVRGSGPETILEGTGRGPVVRFDHGETRATALDSVLVTGGASDDGGGIFIRNASPRIVRSVVFGNAASGSGAGVYIRGSLSDVVIQNNIFAYNVDSTPMITDAHQIFVDAGAKAIILNNTIVRGNGNGILLQGGARRSIVLNNILAQNGSELSSGQKIGRGICDFSREARIRNNLFFDNTRAAILTGAFEDFEFIRDAERAVNEGRFSGNFDGAPRFRRALTRKRPAALDVADLALRPSSPGRNAGVNGRTFQDASGSRNDLGHTGGPLGWR